MLSDVYIGKFYNFIRAKSLLRAPLDAATIGLPPAAALAAVPRLYGGASIARTAPPRRNCRFRLPRNEALEIGDLTAGCQRGPGSDLSRPPGLEATAGQTTAAMEVERAPRGATPVLDFSSYFGSHSLADCTITIATLQAGEGAPSAKRQKGGGAAAAGVGAARAARARTRRCFRCTALHNAAHLVSACGSPQPLDPPRPCAPQMCCPATQSC